MIEILLIDDEPELLEITFEQLTLNFENINISRANSGNEGINLLMKGQKFDLIISDYMVRPPRTNPDLVRVFGQQKGASYGKKELQC